VPPLSEWLAEWREIAADWPGKASATRWSGRMSFGTSLRIVCGSYCGPRRRARAGETPQPVMRPCRPLSRLEGGREGGSGRQTRMRIDPPPRETAQGNRAQQQQPYLTAACAAPFRTNGDCALR
jgi:hypothetical protein